jgi:GR25 family glycosyltransferase involved in LPS biosynthesis
MEQLHCYCIWLNSLKERGTIIENLEKSLQNVIFRFDAFDGQYYNTSFLNYKHIVPNEIITSGNIGCTLSHIGLLEIVQHDKYIIFEDDCECTSTLDNINTFIKSLPDYDIVCLSANEYVTYNSTEDTNVVSVKRFHGSHALIVKKKAIHCILETYNKYNDKKIFLPADWLYSVAIQEHNLKCYGPTNPKQFFKQTSGLVSSINGKVRH